MHLNYKDAEEILDLYRILNRIASAVDTFEKATDNYNATMQDNVAREATKIVEDLRAEIVATRELIGKSSKKAREAMIGLGQIEENAANGGLNV